MNPNQKTIFMPIFHGHVARNVLLTDIYKILANQPDLRLVIFTYDFKKEYYEKNYGRANVIIEGVNLQGLPILFAERIFKSLFPFFVDSPRVRMMLKEALDENHNYLVYYFKRFLLFTIGNSGLIRGLLRKIYFYTVLPKTYFAEKFIEYKPKAVVLPDMTFDVDTYILRVARKFGVPAIGMLRSFDTVTSNKGTIRIQPDKLIVHNKFMKEDAIKWCDYNPNNIIISGMPQFDFYSTSKPTPKTEFFSRMGLDLTKRVILFALTGPRTAGINQDVIGIIVDAIETGQLPADVQLLVRMHPNADPESFKKNSRVTLHRPEGLYFSKGRLTDMEFTREWQQELFDTLYYSDITLNPQSTMSVDAAAFDKPVINIAFDGYEKLPYVRSVLRLYKDYSHYLPILKAGGVRLVYNKEELIEWIRKYLANPTLDREGRQRILLEQGGLNAGQSGEKTANHIIQFVNNASGD